ncbi:MAG: protein translocase subunit SecF [SAR202 cluster bacterium]|nr:protein translocase subunit SecF [SAR202 cluster bacterium]
MSLNFARLRGWFFLFSLCVILPGMYFLLVQPGLKSGIDFSGGSSLTVRYDVPVQQDVLRNALESIGYSESTVQDFGDNTFFLRMHLLEDGTYEDVVAQLADKIGMNAQYEILSFDLVSPVIAREVVLNAFYAVIAAAVGIFIYVWWAFRNVPSPFRYGVAALVALLHDGLVVLGVFALLGWVLNYEVNTMFLIALLTVIGYSVNDTIVVFDRLRENVSIYPNRDFTENVNFSISETIGRSLNTSLTLLLPLLALILFGGQTIQVFLVVLLIGVVAGTYSSIAIASQILVSWHSGDFGRWVLRRNR